MMFHQTTEEERNFRLMLALIGAVIFFIATVPDANWPHRPIGVASVPPLVMAAMATTGALLLFIRYSPHWPAALFSLGSAEMAVLSGWIGAVGVPNLPQPLWIIPSVLFGMVAVILAISAGFLRIIQTVNKGEEFQGLDSRMLWETLLPWALFGGTFLALDGSPFFAFWWFVVAMGVQFFWLPHWKVARTS